MKRIPCTKCPGCGIYNDFTVPVCECGQSLEYQLLHLIDVDQLAREQIDLEGRIDPDMKIYVQRCPSCGTLNFTSEPGSRVTFCRSCAKGSIASVVPTEYLDAPEPDSPEQKKPEAPPVVEKPRPAQAEPMPDTGSWISLLQKNLQDHGIVSEPEKPAQFREPERPEGNSSDQDEEYISWDLDEEDSGEAIRLTADFGRNVSFVVSGDQPYMLGRSSHYAELFQNDIDIGKKHCYLEHRSDGWYVVDNHSANGTFVNHRDLFDGGEKCLQEGDLIQLGHRPDSAAFLVSFER